MDDATASPTTAVEKLPVIVVEPLAHFTLATVPPPSGWERLGEL